MGLIAGAGGVTGGLITGLIGVGGGVTGVGLGGVFGFGGTAGIVTGGGGVDGPAGITGLGGVTDVALGPSEVGGMTGGFGANGALSTGLDAIGGVVGLGGCAVGGVKGDAITGVGAGGGVIVMDFGAVVMSGILMADSGFLSLSLPKVTGLGPVDAPEMFCSVDTPIKAAIALPSLVTTYKLSGSSDLATVSKISENRLLTSS